MFRRFLWGWNLVSRVNGIKWLDRVRTGCKGKYLLGHKRNKQENGEKCIMKSFRICIPRHVWSGWQRSGRCFTQLKDRTNVPRDLIGELDRKRPLGRPRHRNIWVDNIKLIHKETGLRYDPVQCGSVWKATACSLNMTLYTRVPQKAENFMNNPEIIPSLRRTSLCGSTPPTSCLRLKRARLWFVSFLSTLLQFEI